jgi:hypothetical protein
VIQVGETEKDRGRLKITLIEVVNKDMLIREVTESMPADIIEWRKTIHMADSD